MKNKNLRSSTGSRLEPSTGTQSLAQQSLDDEVTRIYHELRLIAKRMRDRRYRNGTLQPTELVHEAYLKLIKSGKFHFTNEGHLKAMAVIAMGWIIRDRIREKAHRPPQTALPDDLRSQELSPATFVAISGALEYLLAKNPRVAIAVALRVFYGLPSDEIGHALSVAPRTVRHYVQFGLAWIRHHLREATV